MENHYETAYITKDVIKILNIGASTLRKWCLALEKNGYHFAKGEQNKRLFVQNDIIALQHLQALVQKENMALEHASMVVVSKFEQSRSSSGTPSVLQSNEAETRSSTNSLDEIAQTLVEYIQKQENFNRELIERLEQQKKFIESSLENRDRQLLTAIREVQETKLLIAATQENQKKWYQFWK